MNVLKGTLSLHRHRSGKFKCPVHVKSHTFLSDFAAFMTSAYLKSCKPLSGVTELDQIMIKV